MRGKLNLPHVCFGPSRPPPPTPPTPLSADALPHSLPAACAPQTTPTNNKTKQPTTPKPHKTTNQSNNNLHQQQQKKSFTYIDDCVEGILRITSSDFTEPLNLGSTEMVSMNDMMATICGFDAEKAALPIKHIPGPEGVRGRNSDNELILEKLGWQPTIKLADGLRLTYGWIKKQIEAEVEAKGADATAAYGTSTICKTGAPTELGSLRKADGAEGLTAAAK